MTTDVLANAASATVTSGGTSAPSPGSSESWTVTTLLSFPSLTTGQVLRVMDLVDLETPQEGGYEIMEVTAIANGTGVLWSVTRGFENTTPHIHLADWTVVPVVTSGALDNRYPQRANNLSDLASVTTARANLGLSTAATQPSSAFDAAGAASAAQAAAIAASDPAGTAAGLVTLELTRAETAEALKLAKASNLADVASAPAALANLGGAPVIFVTNSQSGTNYTPVIGDLGAVIEMTSASDNTVTLNTSVFPNGATFTVCEFGAGTTTFVAGSGFTIDSLAGLSIQGQYGTVRVRYRSGSEAVLSGDLW